MHSTSETVGSGALAVATASSAPSVPVDIARVRAVLRGLDRPQRRAVTHAEGPLLVLAGPGTGKTEVITRRIAWLVATRKARPSQILALTFTDRAGEEMQARVDELVAYGQAHTTIQTFHAFGDRILREHGFALGLPDAPRVIGKAEAVLLLREHLFELGLDRYRPLADPTRFLSALVDLFSRAKSEGAVPEAYVSYAEELRAGAEAVAGLAADDTMREIGAALLDEARGHSEVARAYTRYQDLLRDRALIDHGDQVLLTTGLLAERAAVRAAVRDRYRFVLVDEVQDMDPAQARLLELLVGPSGNVTFVGDDDQAIYAFRGAAVETMLRLPEQYPAMARVVLRANHRSRRPILEASRRLVRHNDAFRLEAREGLDKTLRPVRRVRTARPVVCSAYATTAEEADQVAASIATRVASGTPASHFAVLVRTNADAEPFLRSLRARGLAVRFSGAAGLFAQPEVREVLALLRAIANPASSVDVYGLATSRAYGLTARAMTSLLERTDRRRRSLWESLREAAEGRGSSDLADADRQTLRRLVTDLDASLALAHERPAGEVLYAHLRRSGWLGALIAQAEKGDDAPLRRVARLFEIIADQGSLLEDARVAVLAPHLRALIESGEAPAMRERDETADAVSLLTIHQAKGLEFPVVHVVGLVDGRFPVRGSRGRLPFPAPLVQGSPGASPEELELAEERRLMYVAMTRARDELVLSYAERGRPGGRRRRPSLFLAEALDGPAPLPGPATGLPIAAADPAASARAAPAEAQALPRGSLELSYSQLDDYLACPLRYRLRHELRVPTPPHHALVVGNALHQAIAADLLSRVRGRSIGEGGVMAAYSAHWRSEGFLSREHEDARYEAGARALRRFVEAEPFSRDRELVAVEQAFSFRIGRDLVRGRYDLVTREADGGIVITDHKSSDVREARRARDRARDSLQLQVYALAHEAAAGALPAGLELHFVESGLVGRVAPDQGRLERARASITEAAEGIRAGDFEARPTRTACTFCPYREVCPSAA
jgi:DNA helicase II / ATP-dependent DNA helicase PcrA